MKFQLSLLCFALTIFTATRTTVAGTVPTNFNGYGTWVSGYQDFFQGTSFNSGWTEISAGSPVTAGTSGNFTLPGDGTLHINSGAGDPNKLLYNVVGYDASNQNVLAMIRVNSGANSDGFRGGVAAESSAGNGQGINVLFRQQGNGGDGGNNLGNHVNFLDDAIAWGPSVGGASTWSSGTYYWLREVTTGGTQTASIWAADGVTPESLAATGSWSETGRSGLAGLVADSSGGNGMFQVNYVLIQANGLPSINAGVPEPSSFILCGMGAIGLFVVARRRRKA